MSQLVKEKSIFLKQELSQHADPIYEKQSSAQHLYSLTLVSQTEMMSHILTVSANANSRTNAFQRVG